MRHDAYAGRIFVYQDVVRPLVRAVREEVYGVIVVIFGGFEGEESRDDGLDEPLGEGFVEEGVLDEFGGPGLEAAVGQLLPSGLRRVFDLAK